MFSPFVFPEDLLGAEQALKENEASRKRQLYFGWILHNGHCVKSGMWSVVWQPAELCETRTLWARHWITGLRSSGSLSVQYSTVLLGDLHSHRHCFAVSLACLDFFIFSPHFTYLQLPSGSRLLTSDDVWAQGPTDCWELYLTWWLTADFFLFPAIHPTEPAEAYLKPVK